MLCPNHDNCTANLDQSASIGLEGNYAQHSATVLKNDNIAISSVTTDGDSNIFKGFTEVYKDGNIERLNDPSHCARNLKRAIRKIDFSRQMFGGGKRTRNGLRSIFAENLRRRYLAELSGAKKKHANKKSDRQLKDAITADLKRTPSAIIKCYQGNHKLCNRYSFACFKYGKKLPKNEKLSMTETDEKLLETAILKYLSPKAIAHTYKNTSTQSNEALNRVFSKTNPKVVTSTRNFKGKIAAAVLTRNLRLHEEIGLTQDACQHRVSESMQEKIKINLVTSMILTQQGKRINMYAK